MIMCRCKSQAKVNMRMVTVKAANPSILLILNISPHSLDQDWHEESELTVGYVSRVSNYIGT
jgi:hypothetical protein